MEETSVSKQKIKNIKNVSLDILRDFACGNIAETDKDVLMEVCSYLKNNRREIAAYVNFSSKRIESKAVRLLKFLCDNKFFLRISAFLSTLYLLFNSSMGTALNIVLRIGIFQNLFGGWLLVILEKLEISERLIKEDSLRTVDDTILELDRIINTCEPVVLEENVQDVYDRDSVLFGTLIVADMEFLSSHQDENFGNILECYSRLINDYKDARRFIILDDLSEENREFMHRLLELEKCLYAQLPENVMNGFQKRAHLDIENFEARRSFFRCKDREGDRVYGFVRDSIERITRAPYYGCETDVLRLFEIMFKYEELDCHPGEICEAVCEIDEVISRKIDEALGTSRNATGLSIIEAKLDEDKKFQNRPIGS